MKFFIGKNTGPPANVEKATGFLRLSLVNSG
jgi:hypothetical protein